MLIFSQTLQFETNNVGNMRISSFPVSSEENKSANRYTSSYTVWL